MKTADEMRREIEAMRDTDPLVYRAMTAADIVGMRDENRYLMLAYYALLDLQVLRAELLERMRNSPCPASIEVGAKNFEYAPAPEGKFTDAERLASLVLMWWSDHEYDTDDSGEYNVYNEDPPMVVEAKKILTPMPTSDLIANRFETVR